MKMTELPFIILGFAVLLHVVFVSITIGTGWISAYSRLMAYLKKDSELERVSRSAFRILVVFELFSGVWGTIITVVLAGFFPTLIALATNVLFAPLLIALISIMIRIPSIAAFWYTWGRIDPRVHSAIGLLMAISGFLIPFGFRTLFSEINSPTALGQFLSSGLADPFAAYLSGLFWVLYLHSIFASLSVGGFVVAYLMAEEWHEKGVRIGYRYGLGFLLLQIPVGAVHWILLGSRSQYIFEAITYGPFMPVLVLKVLAVLTLLSLGLKGYLEGKSVFAKYSAFLSLLAVFLGELMNDGSRYPFMVVIAEGGIPISSFANFYIEIPMAAVYVILGFLLLSILVFLSALFYALFRRFLSEPI
jgi:cytochrome d ubiquinol oxidase subunit I